MRKKSSTVSELDEDYKSKTQLKNEAHALQKLGTSLTKLSKAQQQKLPLNDEIYAALRLAEKIRNKHEAFRRHIHYIGKLMRDADHVAIQASLDAMANKHGEQDAIAKRYEDLRTEIVVNGDSQIQQLVNEYPKIDRQKLRQLVRQASKELKQKKVEQEKLAEDNSTVSSKLIATKTKNYNELLRYLKQHVKL